MKNRTSTIIGLLSLALFCMTSCQKEQLPEIKKTNPAVAIVSSRDSGTSNMIAPNESGQSTASYPIITFLTGAKFNLTFYNGECNLRFVMCGPQGAQFTATVAPDTASGNYIIHQNASETFTVTSANGSMQFQVHNQGSDNAMITFVTSGQSNINTLANAIGNNTYNIPTNTAEVFTVQQIRPWLASATPSPTNPN
jgi:hypothetical protein